MPSGHFGADPRAACTKKRRPFVADAALANAIAAVLEGEVHAGAGHAKVVFRTIHKIPAEVTDPADMRGETHFHATADLAHCFCLAICVTHRPVNVEALAPLGNGPVFALPPIDRPLAATKDGAAATEDIR